jgi:UDP-N-acetylmuramoylalanine--D-glutamate ligase
VAAAGNIGPTMLQTLSQALDLEPEREPLARAARSIGDPARDAPPGAQREVPEEVSGDIPEDMTEDVPEVLPEAVRPFEGGDGAALAPPVLAPHRADPAPVFTHLPQVWVLELSSFQLFDVRGFAPDVATVLNITQDHLDWHGSMADYAQAKARVFGTRAVMVINRDDPAVQALVPQPVQVKRGAGRKPSIVSRQVVRFGLGAPLAPGDFGVVEEHGMAWLARARELDETLTRARGGKGSGVAALEDLSIQRLMPADALRVRGRHNTANALAALALATAIGCPMAPMLHGLREYAGEPHRVQYLATFEGVDVYDDSKGTNVGATVAALYGLGVDRAPGRLVLILGGDGKGQDFAPLVEPVRRHVRALALIGRDAGALQEALAGAGVPMQRHAQLQSATRWCFERAQPGDAVLLSPACSSLDMFADYAHRAAVFVEEVHAVMADRGGVAA